MNQNCQKCNQEFVITEDDLTFLKRVSPKIGDQKIPLKLHDRNCDKCGTSIRSTYKPNGSEIVYCEKCYLESLS